MKKVFIIGLDGAPYKEVNEWIDTEELPFLSRIAREGAFGKLRSSIPPVTMIAWPIIFTGKNPAKIGPFINKGKKRGFNADFFSSGQIINSTDIKTWSIWEWASQFGRKVGVVNIPITYPPTKVNGFLIAGFLIPKGAKNFTYPPKLKDKIKGYKIHCDISRKSNKRRFQKELINLLEERTKWVLKLLQKYNPEIFIMNFKEMDEFMHVFWDKKDLILDYFKKADRSIEKMCEISKPDKIIIISDHGFTDAPTKFYYINQYLENNGLLKRSEDFRGKFSNFIYKFGMQVVKRFGFIKSYLPRKLKEKVMRESIKEKIDWTKTKAFANEYAGVYLNPKYYPDVKSKKEGAEEVKKLLIDARDFENGKQIFQYVKTKWELFKGPFFDEMPEVVYTTTKDYMLNINLTGKFIDKNYRKVVQIEGQHFAAPDGVILIHGEGIKKGKSIEGSIEDVFPTVCALGGFPIPQDIDGRILKEVLIEGTYKEKFKKLPYPEKETLFLTKEEDIHIKEHLKDLGYI